MKKLLPLLSFDTMITPKIITFIYYLALLGVVLAGIFSGSILWGVIIIVCGALSVRVYCELMIILFKMNEALQEIRKK
ncbi:MAG: DUF4282 domain-containing protein [Candidatus Accumulibacter sp.]|nr:DUF4282 domain-containing protein [Accumulibacter sp.]